MIEKLYDALIPKSFRLIFIDRIDRIKFNRLKKTILLYYAQNDSGKVDKDILVALEFLKQNPLHAFPYNWQRKYKYRSVEVMKDISSGLFYTIQDKMQLYFKKDLKLWDVKRRYNFLQIEQDPLSPHRYIKTGFDVGPDDVIADIGAAEGNFSLSIVERVKKIYLFEADEAWIEALQKTFEPWKDKVEIVRTFVSDKINESNTTINNYFANKSIKPTFLKIDVEGVEKSVLDGASDFLNEKNIKVALCTYHHENDFKDLSKYMIDKGFQVSPSNGYLLVGQQPYFRKVLIRCTKAVI